ncbi:MAG: extracellular solute-binding protein [Christensenellales bacterium]|jgi:alpha-1,4-digalacturonate transport system substrate-binding protein
MFKTRKLLSLFLGLVLLLAMAGVAQAEEGGTLRVLLSEEPSASDAFGLTLKAWEEATGNKAEPLIIPYDDQLTKFPQMARNNDLPDLVLTTRLTRLYPEEFVDLGTVMDMAIFEERAVQIIGQDYTTDRKTNLPLQFTITNVYYNKDAFDKAGLEAPTVDSRWTMDEVYANARILMEKGGVKYGMAVDGSRARYDNLMYMNGGSMVVEKDGAFQVAIHSQANIDTLNTFIAMNNEGVLPKSIWAGGTTDNPADYFANGDLGMYFSGSWNYNRFFAAELPFAFGVMPSPVGAVGGSAILGGSGLAVPNNAKNKDLAISFLRWLYEEEDGAHFQNYLNIDKGLSSLKAVTYQPEAENAKADYAVLQAEVGQVTDLFSVDESSSWRNFLDNEYRDAIKQAVHGDMSAKEALEGFAQALAEKSGWALQVQ